MASVLRDIAGVADPAGISPFPMRFATQIEGRPNSLRNGSAMSSDTHRVASIASIASAAAVPYACVAKVALTTIGATVLRTNVWVRYSENDHLPSHSIALRFSSHWSGRIDNTATISADAANNSKATGQKSRIPVSWIVLTLHETTV